MYGLLISLLHNIVACGNYLHSEMTMKTLTLLIYICKILVGFHVSILRINSLCCSIVQLKVASM